MSDESNVRSLVVGLDTAESALRDALSLCAAIRSRGHQADAVIFVVENGHKFTFSKTSIDTYSMAACAVHLLDQSQHDIRNSGFQENG